MDQFDEIIENTSPEIKAIALKLRAMLLQLSQPVQEEIMGGAKVKFAYYNIGEYNNALGVIGPAKDHCKLYLHHTGDVDQRGLKFEGKGKHAKHVKFYDEKDIDENLLIGLLNDIATILAKKR